MTALFILLVVWPLIALLVGVALDRGIRLCNTYG